VLAPGALEPVVSSGKGAGGTSAAGKGVAIAVAVAAVVAGGLVVRAHRRGPVEDARRYAWTAPLGVNLKIFGAPLPAPEGTLLGLVRQADGRPAPGAVVTARRRPSREGRPAPTSIAITTAEGTFAFPALADGDYDLTAAAADALSAAAGPVAIRGAAAVRDVVLTLGSGGFRLTGRLLDGGGGAVPGATLQARAGNTTYTARADDQGRYALRLGKAVYRLEADADGYAPRPGSVDLVGDMVRDFRLDPAGRMVGTVVDGPSGKPVAGAIVRAEAGERPPSIAHTTSDEQGRFVFGDLLPGEYVVSARAGARVGFRSGHLAVPVAGEADAGSVPLEAAFEIAGRVTGTDGKPVAGATVYVDDVLFDKGAFGGASMATSDGDGRYRIEGVAPGRLRVRAGGVLPWAPSASALVVVKDASVHQDFTLPAGGKLQGQVLGPDGSQAGGATVMVSVRDSEAMDSPFRGTGGPSPVRTAASPSRDWEPGGWRSRSSTSAWAAWRTPGATSGPARPWTPLSPSRRLPRSPAP
jgi:protocatechuate 3,4-dioxygenase beta subunit